MAATNDPFDLQRFVDAQARIYDTVVGELTRGRKRSHWIWFIFPQLAGLGRSPTAHDSASRRRRGPGVPGARVLGPGFGSARNLSTRIDGRSIEAIFGWPDDLKVRSSMTLFARATDDNDVFRAVLDKYYGGEEDAATVDLLSRGSPALASRAARPRPARRRPAAGADLPPSR